MFTFQDLMRQAQGGQAVDNLARAYGLKPADIEKLMGTLLPVFSLGMKKSITDLTTAASFADMLDGSKMRAAYEDASAAINPAATETARIMLDKLFGSGDAAKVIAEQTASVTGIGADVISRVMPAMAATLLGGIAKELESGPFAGVFRAMGGDAGNPMSAVTNPIKDAMGAFLKGYARGDAPEKPAGGVSSGWPGMDVFTRYFEPGVDLAESNRRLFEQMFDGFKR